MKLDELAGELDAYFRVPQVRDDDWSPAFEHCYPDPYWRESWRRATRAMERADGARCRGGRAGRRPASSRATASSRGSSPGTLLFSEHPLDFADEPGFLPLSRESFEALKERACGFYHAHAPLDMHPEVSPSRLCAQGVGLEALEEYYPICDGIPGGAAIIGDSDLSLEGLAEAFRAYLGPEIKVHVITRPRPEAGRVAVVAGGGADAEVLRESIDRGCVTYVTGNAATNCRLDFVQEKVRAFRKLADEAEVALVDAMHYGMEKPPQLAMVSWFRRLGLHAEFVPDGPK